MQTQMITFQAPKSLIISFDKQLKKTAQSRSEFYRQTMQKFLKEERLFERVFTYGQKQAKKLGIKESDVDSLVHEVREGK